MVNVYTNPVNLKSILHFTMPTIIMTVFISLYTMVDGFFIANVQGTDALAAINLVKPFTLLLSAVSIMLARGGCALVMKKMGEGKETEARQDFSMLMIVNVFVGIITLLLSLIFINSIINILGATDEVFEYSKTYLTYYVIFSVPMILKISFEQFKIASGKASSALTVAIIGGVLNIILDFTLIVVLDMGICGAAIATGGSYLISGLISMQFFVNKNSLIHFTLPKWRPVFLMRTVVNGCSEMDFLLATSIITFLLNNAMLRYIGIDGVSAITIVMYAFLLISSLYTGYVIGVSPMLSYYYGEEHRDKTKAVVKISIKMIAVVSIVTWLASILLTPLFVRIYADAGTDVFYLAKKGNYIFSTVLLFSGFNSFIRVMFTAFLNGLISAILVFLRLFVLTILAILILPLFLNSTGIWLAVPLAEGLAMLISVIYYEKYRPFYGCSILSSLGFKRSTCSKIEH